MITDRQIRKLRRLDRRGIAKEVAALRVGMDAKSARKYRRLGKLPSELGKGDATQIGEACRLHLRCSWVATFYYFFGGSSGRKVVSKSSVLALSSCQVGTPYELPGVTNRLTPANSASVDGPITNSVQAPARGSGQRRNRLFPRAVPRIYESRPLFLSRYRGDRRGFRDGWRRQRGGRSRLRGSPHRRVRIT